MLFDLWADGYDKSVNLTEEANAYPFAGYRDVMNFIYGALRTAGAHRVLDLGFGTGVLAARLAQDGCAIIFCADAGNCTRKTARCGASPA